MRIVLQRLRRFHPCEASTGSRLGEYTEFYGVGMEGVRGAWRPRPHWACARVNGGPGGPRTTSTPGHRRYADVLVRTHVRHKVHCGRGRPRIPQAPDPRAVRGRPRPHSMSGTRSIAGGDARAPGTTGGVGRRRWSVRRRRRGTPCNGSRAGRRHRRRRASGGFRRRAAHRRGATW